MLVILLSALCPLRSAFAAQFTAEDELNFDCAGVILYSLDTGEEIYSKNADVRYQPASLAKLLTALVAQENCADLEGTQVTVTPSLWTYFESGVSASLAGIQPGEVLSMYDLLCCLLIPSGCEAAVAIACYFGYDEFMRKVNEKAVQLGCTDTYLANPHGLYDENSYTTASDMRLVANAVIACADIYEICCRSRCTLPETNKNASRTLASTNLMTDRYSDYYLSYIKGLKTGYTQECGRNLITTASRGGVSYAIILLGGPVKTDGHWTGGYSTFNDAYAAFSWCYANLSLSQTVKTTTAVAQIEVKGCAGRDVLVLYPAQDVAMTVQSSAEAPVITYEFKLPDYIYAPVAAGQEIGTAVVCRDGVAVAEIQLVSREDIERSYFVGAMDTLTQILSTKTAKIIYAVLILLILLYIYYMKVIVVRARKRKKR